MAKKRFSLRALVLSAWSCTLLLAALPSFLYADFKSSEPAAEAQTESASNTRSNSKPETLAPADSETENLVNPEELAAAAQHRMRISPGVESGSAVVLADVRIERVSGGERGTVRCQRIYYVAGEQAARAFRNRAIQYFSGAQELELLHARLYKPDGRVLNAEDKDIDSLERQPDMDDQSAGATTASFSDAREARLRFPGLEPGDVIEIDYRLAPSADASQRAYLGAIVPFASNLETALQRYVLITPAKKTFNIIAPHMAPAVVTERGTERIYRWETHDTPPLPAADQMRPRSEVAPYVHVSTFQSWSELGQWYAQLIRPQFAADSTIRQTASRLQTTSELETIRAINEFVLHSTRYVAQEFGIYSYKPYPVTQTLARRFGDCKDKASLMVALLREAGIDGQLALVRTRKLGDVDAQAVSMAVFDHAVVYLPKYDLWLDGTAEHAPAGEIPWEDQGAMALTVSLDGSATLRRIPTANSWGSGNLQHWQLRQHSVQKGHSDSVNSETMLADLPLPSSQSPGDNPDPGAENVALGSHLTYHERREADFYVPYLREGMDQIRRSELRQFSGGTAVVVLDHRVVNIDSEGQLSVYTHKIIRLLNGNGIQKYGEVTLPPGAKILQLRTVKQDGSVIAPEFTPQEAAVSMPALASGDAIEEEYLAHYGDSRAAGAALRFVFGSYETPILSAMYVVISPAAMPIEALVTGRPPQVEQNAAHGSMVRMWEQQDIAQSTGEVSMAQGGNLPTIRIVSKLEGGWQQLRDFYQGQFQAATRVGAVARQRLRELLVSRRMEEAVGPALLQVATNESGGHELPAEDDLAALLYHFVTTRIDSTGCDMRAAGLFRQHEQEIGIAGTKENAEETLTHYRGCRTTALLALARAAGLDTTLLLARDADTPRPAAPAWDIYRRPLVGFHLATREIVADAESDGLAFGVLPPTIAREEVLNVPSVAGDQAGGEAGSPQESALFVSVPAPEDELSTAEGDITFDRQGTMSAQITIRMGAFRGAQIRAILNGIEPGERAVFLQKMAMRLFPGTSEATGEIIHDDDGDRPLELLLKCRVPRALAPYVKSPSLDQLAPALALSKMYGTAPRKTALYIDSPLVETTTFHVHLPPEFALSEALPRLSTQNGMGSYAFSVSRLSASEFVVRRSFRIPVQVISPERFAEFVRFERQIDRVEGRRLTLMHR